MWAGFWAFLAEGWPEVTQQRSRLGTDVGQKMRLPCVLGTRQAETSNPLISLPSIRIPY